MPDKEEIISNLMLVRCYLECFAQKPGLVELVDDALSLLKEQEAKSIIRKQCKREYPDGTVEYFAEWHCPHCNSLITCGFDAPWIKYCCKCGKPILLEGR